MDYPSVDGSRLSIKFMHDHECRYCEERFICPKDAAECFRKYLVCQECLLTREFRYLLLVIVLVFVAAWMTLFVISNIKKTGAVANDRAGLFGKNSGAFATRRNKLNTTQGEYNNAESAATQSFSGRKS